ncbi:MAG: hypothetical protein DESF_00985 [Desulfovibrio sp.]
MNLRFVKIFIPRLTVFVHAGATMLFHIDLVIENAYYLQLFLLEQFHFEIALAAARADARREGVSAIYLRG